MPVPLILDDGRACGLDVMRNLDGGYAPETDRRGRVRVALSVAVYVFLDGALDPIIGRTKNLSAGGFYCHLNEPLVVGRTVRAIIMIPACSPLNGDRAMSLECNCRVIRVEPLEPPKRYGIACHIDNYRVLTAELNYKSSAIV
jgi:hypothetical protein